MSCEHLSTLLLKTTHTKVIRGAWSSALATRPGWDRPWR